MQFAETHDAWLGRRVCSVARRPEHYTCTCRVSAFGKDVENGDFIVASNGDVGCVEACVNDGASFFWWCDKWLWSKGGVETLCKIPHE